MYQLSKAELRASKASREEFKKQERFPVVCVLDNLKNMHNVGVIIRTCEAFRIQELIINSSTEVLESKKVLKSALSAWKWLPMRRTQHVSIALEELKQDGFEIIAVELTDSARSYKKLKNDGKKVFIFGNEDKGISEEVLSLCDKSVVIPMHGMANSINVSSAVGIILSHVIK